MGVREAEQRWADTFGPTPKINKGAISNVERQRVNRYVRNNADILIAKRERAAKRVAGVIAGFYLNKFAEVLDVMEQRGLLREITDDVVRVYDALRTPTTSDAEVQRFIKENATDRQIDAFLERRIGDAAERVDFSEDEKLLLRSLVLLAESGALFVQRQVRSLRSDTLIDVGLLRAGTETKRKALLADQVKLLEGFGIDDDLYVDIVMGKPPDQLIAAIDGRKNFLQMRKQMFDDFKRGMKQDLYHRIGGAAGAAEIARRLTDEYKKELIKKGVDIKKRALLWARTEGAIMQNDALIIKGIEAGMDGKRWVNVGDDRVRTFATGPGDHVRNMGDGIIPMQADFTDGSFDGGSGSVSPYNCRCTVGPSMLPSKTPAATGPARAPEIPSIVEPPQRIARPQDITNALNDDLVEDFIPINPNDVLDEANQRLEEILNALSEEMGLVEVEIFDAGLVGEFQEGTTLIEIIATETGDPRPTNIIEHEVWKKSAKRIAARTGLSEDDALKVLGDWAGDAQEILNGAVASATKKELPEYFIEEFGDLVVDEKALQAAQAMYADTQEFFARKGITHVDLYRGVHVDEDSLDVIPKTGIGSMVGTSNVSSWSLNEGIAYQFADAADTDFEFGLLMHARIPVSRILSTPATGAGTAYEAEMVVLSSPDVKDRVHMQIVSKPGRKRRKLFSFIKRKAEGPLVIDFTRMPRKLALKNAFWLSRKQK